MAAPAALPLTSGAATTVARRRFEYVGGISVSLEVIRSYFAPREKPNATKGQGDNKRLQPQAERSSISRPRSIWTTFTNFSFQTQRHKTKHLLFSLALACMIYANDGCEVYRVFTTTWMCSGGMFTLPSYKSDIVVCLILIYATDRPHSGEKNSSSTITHWY